MNIKKIEKIEKYTTYRKIKINFFEIRKQKA